MTKHQLNLYNEYKDSEIKWLGNIPKHWNVQRLKDIKANIANAFVDGPFGSNLKTEHFIDDGEVYVIDSGFITSGKFEKHRDFKTISFEHFLTVRRSECHSDDVIIAKIGANFGMSGILPQLDKPSLVSGNTLKLSLNKKKVYLKYIHYQLLNLKVNGVFDALVKGSAQPALSLGLLNTLAVPISSFSEQQAIADYLDAKTTQIDRKIELLEQKAEKYADLKQSLINETVTRGLDKIVPMKDSGVEWIGQIPVHWEVKRLKDIGKSIIGLTYSPDEVVDDNEPDSILVLRSSNIQNGRLSLLDNVYVKRNVQPKLMLKKGDILICARNGSRALIGKNICIDERTAGQTFGAFMTVYRSKYFEFLSKFFNSNMFESQSGLFMSSTVNQLTQNTLNNFLVPLPPLSEQKTIAEYLETKTAHIEKIIETINLEVEKLYKLRKTLVNDVVTGKIKVYEG